MMHKTLEHRSHRPLSNLQSRQHCLQRLSLLALALLLNLISPLGLAHNRQQWLLCSLHHSLSALAQHQGRLSSILLLATHSSQLCLASCV